MGGDGDEDGVKKLREYLKRDVITGRVGGGGSPVAKEPGKKQGRFQEGSRGGTGTIKKYLSLFFCQLK